MAGALIRVYPKTDQVQDQVGTSAIDTVLVPRIDVPQWTSIVLVGRIHAKSTTSTAQTLVLLVKNIAPSIDDIAADFVGGVVATATFTISTFTAGPQTPQIIQFATPIAASVRLIMRASQATAGGAFTFSLSCDFVGRE